MNPSLMNYKSTLRPQGAFWWEEKAMSLSEIEKKIEGKEIKSVEDARKYLTERRDIVLHGKQYLLGPLYGH